MTLAGDTVFGDGRYDIRSQSTANVGLLDVNPPGGANLTKLGANAVQFYNIQVDSKLKDISILAGRIQIANTAGFTNQSLGNPANTIYLTNGATLDLYNASTDFVPVYDKKIGLLGDGIILKQGAGTSWWVGTVDLGSGGYTLWVTNQQAAGLLVISNAISGNGNLQKGGPYPVTLLGTNTYTGNTTVNGGTLAIAVASIATNSTVSVSDGACCNWTSPRQTAWRALDH